MDPESGGGEIQEAVIGTNGSSEDVTDKLAKLRQLLADENQSMLIILSA